jgi:hypothetical protein
MQNVKEKYLCHTVTHKEKRPEPKKQSLPVAVLWCPVNCHTHMKRTQTSKHTKERSTSRHNQTATHSKRPHQNRLFCQASKKMKNKAAHFFFYKQKQNSTVMRLVVSSDVGVAKELKANFFILSIVSL